MGEKNRQHYVPKFYLRNFSDNEKSINSYNLVNSKYIENASIKNMCQRNNFYGEDKRVEEFLDKEIERKAANIVRKINAENKMVDNLNEYIHLIQFLLVSEARNLKSAESYNNMINYMAKQILSIHPDTKDIDLTDVTIGIKQPANTYIKIALDQTESILDLEPLLIIEKTGSRKFITSDNPLLRYNSLYLQRKYPGGFGLINRGLQLFFPISPSKCILLYDRLAYDIPNVNNGLLYLNRARDVDKLNELFYLNGYNNIFFNQLTKREYVERIHLKHHKSPKIKDLHRETGSLQNTLDPDDQVIHFSPNNVSTHVRFSWLDLSGFAKKIILPNHFGGLKRMESPFIREMDEKEKADFEKNRSPIKNNSIYKKV